MFSGVKASNETVEAFEAMTIKKKFRYTMLHIDEGKIKVLSRKEKSTCKSEQEEFSEFRADLPEDIGRYCIVDLAVPQKNGLVKNKLFIITW